MDLVLVWTVGVPTALIEMYVHQRKENEDPTLFLVLTDNAGQWLLKYGREPRDNPGKYSWSIGQRRSLSPTLDVAWEALPSAN